VREHARIKGSRACDCVFVCVCVHVHVRVHVHVHVDVDVDVCIVCRRRRVDPMTEGSTH